jgi:hypothetical protein
MSTRWISALAQMGKKGYKSGAAAGATALHGARRHLQDRGGLGHRATLHVDEHHRHPLLDRQHRQRLVDRQPGGQLDGRVGPAGG